MLRRLSVVFDSVGHISKIFTVLISTICVFAGGRSEKVTDMRYKIQSCFAILAIWLLAASSLSAQQWDFVGIHNNIAHFAFPSPLTIERYDLASQSFLDPLPLSGSATAMTVDDDAVYVSYFTGETVRIEHDGSGETVLLTTPGDPTQLAVAGDFLFVIDRDEVWSVNKTTGVLSDTVDYFYSMVGVSSAPSRGSLYARSSGISPSDIIRVDFSDTGELLGQDDRYRLFNVQLELRCQPWQ